MELLFLLFTYQGASAAEARLIHSGCFSLVVLGVVALVSPDGPKRTFYLLKRFESGWHRKVLHEGAIGMLYVGQRAGPEVVTVGTVR